MPAYLIAQVAIRDPIPTEPIRRAPRNHRQAWWTDPRRGGATEVLEGSADNRRVVVVEFPSMEARAPFTIPRKYQQAKEIRTPHRRRKFLIVQGVE